MRHAHHRHTYPEYLGLQSATDIKLEFFEGEIYAMAGGTPEHAALSMALGAQLVQQLEGKPCRVFSSDLRVRVSATGLTTYPDASVVCGRLEMDPIDNQAVTNPTVLVEVLSPSTEDYDRGKKLENYQRMPSVKDIVLVSHREALIEVFSRDPSGAWVRSEARKGGSVRLESIGCSLSVDRLNATVTAPDA